MFKQLYPIFAPKMDFTEFHILSQGFRRSVEEEPTIISYV